MRKWFPFIVVGAIIMGASAYWFYSQSPDAAKLMQMLPPDKSLHLYVNVAALRTVGVLEKLAGSPALEEPDYKQFVERSGFNYRTDLDAVGVAFREGDRFLVAQGRFNWDKLTTYALSQGGLCERFICKMPSNLPGKVISFYMPRGDVLALASSSGANAGDMIGPGTWANPPEIGTAALWISAPPFLFSDLPSLPAGARSFLSPLADAKGTIFTIGLAANVASPYQLEMEVTAKDPKQAEEMAKRFTEATDLLVKMMARENVQANPDDMSGFLTAGKFAAKDSTVAGTWPLHEAFLESLAAGALAVEESAPATNSKGGSGK